MKNIALCFDGTGNLVRAEGNTNVILLFKRLTYDPARQLTYYDPGVGTFSSGGAWTPAARWVSRTLGLAFGSGMRENLENAYTYLINHWEPGDQIYLFGFSRGAYTARAMAGLLRTVGILRPGADNLVRYAIGNYARRKSRWRSTEWKQAGQFGSLMSRRTPQGKVTVPVAYLGVWDTVKAPGLLRRSMVWPYTRALPNVKAGRHAISIDEKRRPYREYLVDEKASARIEEVWFAGVHSDVGGSYTDKPPLGEITLNWIADGARDAGLLFEDEPPLPVLTPEHATGPIHKMSWAWSLLVPRRRPVPAGAKVHASVRARIERQPGYGRRLPSDVVWAEPDWLGAAEIPAKVE
ncbi:DUF2235 domain-containing protein [Mycobacterium hubeiense]|uniref:DUF2235 domain-containing protein n=1 Tax=Mycobacterium hubeiense TaxID=1867256 RepID=UPI000C7EE31F|nr:DUF2235 domain-containing protein [Mycobacterium sp. QGD 101]